MFNIKLALSTLFILVVSTLSEGWLLIFKDINQVNKANQAHASEIQNQTNLENNLPQFPQQIAAPPIIRKAPIDLQNSLAEDFSISQQNPNSKGRNEILFTSASTGTEKRFEINLPGKDGFQLYSTNFNQVKIDNPDKLIRNGSNLTPEQVEQKLNNFQISYQNNLVSQINFDDGTKAEFSQQEINIKDANNQIIETLPVSQSSYQNSQQDLIGFHKTNFSKLTAEKFAQNRLPHNNKSCTDFVKQDLYQVTRAIKDRSSSLKSLKSNYGHLVDWALTFGAKAIESSLVADSRNVTLQEIACRQPVQCDLANVSGGSEIRTDLFQVPVGTNRQVNLEYEFYQIPDRLELYHDGKLLFEVGFVGGNDTQVISLPNGVNYIGVKLIGNQDKGTKWRYKIACSSKNNQLGN